ncbi:hypothetical protein SAMN04515620_12021 [Collimonas sp. OK607]|nr:hypothetical protein SAMN04515620_12021 [Collimonas sp. OK607]
MRMTTQTNGQRKSGRCAYSVTWVSFTGEAMLKKSGLLPVFLAKLILMYFAAPYRFTLPMPGLKEQDVAMRNILQNSNKFLKP